MHRYSDRLAWNAAANSFSELLSKLRNSGRALLDLTISNPTQALEDYPHAEIGMALGSIANVAYTPEPFGSPVARAAIVADMHMRFAEIDVAPSQVALTASTSEAYAILFKLVANPGDEILVPMPSYPLFEYLAQLEGVKIRPYRLAYDGSWYIDFASLEAAIGSRSRAIIVVNPNNPTGSFLKRSEYARLVEIARVRCLPLISDEVFMDYAFAQSDSRVATLAGQHEVLSFCLNGLSKAAAMPQMKLGWIVVNGPRSERAQACARLELLLDTYLSVGTPVQMVADRLLQIGKHIQGSIRLRIERNLATLKRALQNSSIHMLNSEGGWSAILRVPDLLTEEEWITRLANGYGVIVQPGYFFDMAGGAFLMISLLTDEVVFATGIERLLTLAQSL